MGEFSSISETASGDTARGSRLMASLLSPCSVRVRDVGNCGAPSATPGEKRASIPIAGASIATGLPM
jgi:hypothetical protein